MGYYSFYKIIKDIIKTIFGSKFWRFTLIFIIAFTIFFIMGEKGVFAVDENYLYYINNRTGQTLDVSNLQQYYYWIVCTYARSQNYYCYQYVVSDQEFTYNSSTKRFYIANGAKYNWGSGVEYQSYSQLQNSINNLTLRQTANNNYYIDFQEAYATGYNSISLSSVVYSNNFDIKNQNNETQYPSTIIPPFVNPNFYNKDNFINFTDDSLIIYPNDYSVTDTLYLHMLTVDSTIIDGNDTYYYYGQSSFALNNNTEYFDVIDRVHYYNIPRYIFSLEANKKYIFFLSDTDKSINNSIGLYDFSEDFDGFILEPTTEQITASNTIIDNQQNQNDKLNNIDNFLNNDNIDNKTNEDIDNSLNKDTSTNSDMIVTSFFTRLTNIITELGDYNLQEDTEIVLPVPFTNGNIVLHSNYLYTYLSPAFKVIIEGFWYYLFGFYIFKFVNKIYIFIKSGKILDGVSSSDEVITNDML